VPVGSQVTFTYVVTNPDGVPLKPLTPGAFVTDDNETPSNSGDDFRPTAVLDPDNPALVNAGDDNGNGWLDPGEVWLYTWTKTVTAGQHTNVGTAVGQPVDAGGNPLGGIVTDTDAATGSAVRRPGPAPSVARSTRTLAGTG